MRTIIGTLGLAVILITSSAFAEPSCSVAKPEPVLKVLAFAGPSCIAKPDTMVRKAFCGQCTKNSDCGVSPCHCTNTAGPGLPVCNECRFATSVSAKAPPGLFSSPAARGAKRLPYLGYAPFCALRLANIPVPSGSLIPERCLSAAASGRPIRYRS